MTENTNKGSFVSAFLDHVVSDKSLKNDRELADKLQIAPTVVSALRHGRHKFGATYLIRAHKAFGYEISFIEDFIEGR